MAITARSTKLPTAAGSPGCLILSANQLNLKPTKTARVAHIREQLATNERWALSGLLRIYSYQTESEQATLSTRDENGVGFNGVDAELLSSFAEQYKERGRLSPKQMGLLMSKMPKYAGQLEKISKK